MMNEGMQRIEKKMNANRIGRYNDSDAVWSISATPSLSSVEVVTGATASPSVVPSVMIEDDDDDDDGAAAEVVADVTDVCAADVDGGASSMAGGCGDADTPSSPDGAAVTGTTPADDVVVAGVVTDVVALVDDGNEADDVPDDWDDNDDDEVAVALALEVALLGVVLPSEVSTSSYMRPSIS